MIYLWYEQDYERTRVTAVYQAPEGLDISEEGFLRSLGVRPRPPGPYSAEVGNQWWEERCQALEKNGIEKSRASEAHHEWVANHPQVRELEFEEL